MPTVLWPIDMMRIEAFIKKICINKQILNFFFCCKISFKNSGAIRIASSAPTNRLFYVTKQFIRILPDDFMHKWVLFWETAGSLCYLLLLLLTISHKWSRVRCVGPWTHFSMVTTVRNSNQRFQSFSWMLRIKCKFITEMENVSEFSINCYRIPISRHQIDSSKKFYILICVMRKKSVCHSKVDAHS